MIINKSMFAISAGYSAISKMQAQLGTLQTQLGSGEKASTLADMGGDRSVSLALRGRLTKLDAYSENITTVNLRLSFLDQAFTALNSLKSETRNSATPTSYGENNLTMKSLQKDSQNRLSMLVEVLNSNIGGRYLMGGNATENPPVASYDAIMNGLGNAAGFLQVADERKRADLGAETGDTLSSVGLPRMSIRGTRQNTLVVSSSEFERFGYKLTSISGNTATTQTSGPTAEPLAPQLQMGTQPATGDQVTLTFTKKDGTAFSFVAQAGTATDLTTTPPTYAIGADAAETAANLEAMITDKFGPLDQFKSVTADTANVKLVTYSDGSDALSVKFTTRPADGEVLSIGVTDKNGVTTQFQFKAVSGTPDPAADPLEYQIGASIQDTLKNLQSAIGEKLGTLSAPLATGRLETALPAGGDTVTLSEQTPPTVFGYKIGTASTTSGKINVSSTSGVPASVSVQFMDNPRSGEGVTLAMTMPDGTTTSITLQAVDREPGIGQFSIGATPEETARNFQSALKLQLDQTSKTELVAASSYAAANNFFNGSGEPIKRVSGDPATATTLMDAPPGSTVDWYIGQDGGNARLSASAQIDDSTRVGYGVRANETGMLTLMRTLAAMSVQEYDINDPTSKERFSAMVTRQMANTSTSTATQEGSIESITLELGVVKSTTGKALERNIAYQGQLETLLADTEQVGLEETAMKLLQIKTRLEAAYSTTASISQLSLVNYLR